MRMKVGLKQTRALKVNQQQDGRLQFAPPLYRLPHTLNARPSKQKERGNNKNVRKNSIDAFNNST